MVLRYSIRCLVCAEVHTLRISIGHAVRQEHCFNCTSCGEEIIVCVVNNHESLTCTPQCVENGEEVEVEGTIVNLHPDFLVPEEMRHADEVFPWLADVTRAVESDMSQLSPEALARRQAEGLEFVRASGRAALLDSEWGQLSRAWSLELNDRSDLAKAICDRAYSQFGYESVPKSTSDWLFRFSLKQLGTARLSLFESVAEGMREACEESPQEASRFREFYMREMQHDHMCSYFDAFRQYFRGFSDFSQTLQYQRRGLGIPPSLRASSMNFDRTKMIYGECFECLTSNLSILVCLQNLSEGRAFEQLSESTLEEYLRSHKASRCRPLETNSKFGVLCPALKSTIRNASHHGGMRLNRETQVVHYRSGGTGAERSISYVEYLVLCNKIFAALCTLVTVELMLGYEESLN